MHAHVFWDNGRGVNQTPRYPDYRASVFQTDRNKILDLIAVKFCFEPAVCDRQVTQGYVVFFKYPEILVKPDLCDGILIEWTLTASRRGKTTPQKLSGSIPQISEDSANTTCLVVVAGRPLLLSL